MPLIIAGVLAVVVLLVAGGLWWNGQRRGGPSATGVSQGPSGPAGPTNPTGPAVPNGFVSCVGGRLCPKTATCWLGAVVIGGNATAKKVDCAQTHYRETFVAGYLPADAVGINFDELQQREDIKQMCSMSVLLARRLDPATTGTWEWQALAVQVGPDWVVHCQGSRKGEGGRTGALFRAGA